MEIHVGMSGYGYKEWKGKFFPRKISPGGMRDLAVSGAEKSRTGKISKKIQKKGAA